MTSMSMRSSSDEIAELRREIKELRSLVQTAPTSRRTTRTWKRPMALVGTALLTVGMLAGVAGASGTTTNVSFVALSPAKVILTNVSLAAQKSTSPVVIGGTTTVPSNATTVQVAVTAKGASSGTIDIFPAQNVSGQSGQTLTYPGGNATVSTTVQENVGQSGELTFYNAAHGTAVIGAKIVGYSTQVTAGDINSVGGASGQLLTSDGNGGASWQAPAHLSHLAGMYGVSSYSGTFGPGVPTWTMGAYTTVPVQAGQTVQASITASLGTANATPVGFFYGLCYQGPQQANPILFDPSTYSAATTIGNTATPFTAGGVFPTFASGNYKVGMCVYDNEAQLNRNDWSTGSVLVFSP